MSLTRFSTAWRIDASIRPLIDVNYMEAADHRVFDVSFEGIFIQCVASVFGYSWMYALTRRSKLSILAALPPFLLNILYAGTHSLCSALDVFVSLFELQAKPSQLTPSGLAFIRRYTLHFSLPSCLLALALCCTRSCVRLRMVIRHTKLPGNNNTSLLPLCSALVRRSIRLSSTTRKLQYARFCGRFGSSRRSAGNTYLCQRLQSFSPRFWSFPVVTWSF